MPKEIANDKQVETAVDKLPANLLQRLKGSSHEERVLHRLHCVALVKQGFSALKIAGIYNDSPRAVAYWVKSFAKEGIDGLMESKRSGRPKKLTADQLIKVQRFIATQRKRGTKITSRKVMSFIFKELGVKISERQSWRVLSESLSEPH